MAALRHLLNARGTEAKMAALGYQISTSGPQVPDKTEQDRVRGMKTSDSTSKLVQSKYNNEPESSAWQQHPALRRDQSSERSTNDYPRSSSFDDYSATRPHNLLRTQTDSNLNGSSRDDNGFSMDTSSIYEENESPALSPALNKHLALRPLNTSTSSPQMQEETPKSSKQRRRSRSVTEEGTNAYYGADPWENYRKEPSGKPKRKESLQTSKPAEESNSTQHLRDRQRSPTQLNKVGLVIDADEDVTG